jgi:hypothetical protein
MKRDGMRKEDEEGDEEVGKRDGPRRKACLLLTPGTQERRQSFSCVYRDTTMLRGEGEEDCLEVRAL